MCLRPPVAMGHRNPSLTATPHGPLKHSRTGRSPRECHDVPINNNSPPRYHLFPHDVNSQNAIIGRTSQTTQPLPGTSLSTQQVRTEVSPGISANEMAASGNPGKNLPKKVDAPKRRWYDHGWAWEITATVLSSCALATSVILLARLNGRALHEWQLFVSINTVISILAAISRTTLAFSVASCLGQAKWNWFKREPDNIMAFERFEDASRGPLGGLRLLVRVHVR